jgi:hypothetical protein
MSVPDAKASRWNPFRSPRRVLVLILIGPVAAMSFAGAVQAVNPGFYVTTQVSGQIVVVRAR